MQRFLPKASIFVMDDKATAMPYPYFLCGVSVLAANCNSLLKLTFRNADQNMEVILALMRWRSGLETEFLNSGHCQLDLLILPLEFVPGWLDWELPIYFAGLLFPLFDNRQNLHWLFAGGPPIQALPGQGWELDPIQPTRPLRRVVNFKPLWQGEGLPAEKAS
jgi:hypothetical protein